MAKLKQFTAWVTNKEWISEQVVKIDFKILNPFDFFFEPGQHISLKIGDKTARPYSIYSTLKNNEKISIVVSAAHEGVGANYLRNLKVGSEVSMMGPVGRLILPDDLKNNLVFVATGTGIVPFMTMFYKLVSVKYTGNIMVYFGIKDRAEIFFREELEEFKKLLPNFNYKICLSNPKQDWEGCLGHVTNAFEIDDNGNTQYFVCGVRAMVKDVVEKLESEGVSKEDIIK